MNQPEIRLMRPDDLERVNRFFDQLGPEARMFFNRNDGNRRVTLRFFDGTDKEPRRRWIAVENGEMVGYVFLKEIDRGVPWLGIAVAESMRGRHFGQTLIETAESWCREQGKGGILLITHIANIRAQTLYERCGFERLGVHSATNELLYIKRF